MNDEKSTELEVNKNIIWIKYFITLKMNLLICKYEDSYNLKDQFTYSLN
jgi:hypothetical protein